ncbi:MAG TPA: flavohemoglobin expression-modulating QEGLA motif protein [Acidimicrobiia bacterium]
MPDPYREAVRTLSDRIVEAQKPIKVLSAINWDDEIKAKFFAADFKEQPEIDKAYYDGRKIKMDADATRSELRQIEADLVRQLGPVAPAGILMRFMCEQFRLTIDMLQARGTEQFSTMSSLLYGTPHDVFHVGGPTICDIAAQMRKVLSGMEVQTDGARDERNIPGTEAVAILRKQVDASMGPGMIEIRADDGIAADAAAGSDYIKVREDRMFSQRDLDLLEAHEAWVHVGTTANGLAQPTCTFLGKAAPRSTVTQEGLAVLTEMLNLRSHPRRLAKLMHRIEGIKAADEGASFVEVFELLRTDGLSEDESWAAAARMFRGSLPEAGPFTKDLGYSKGLVLTLLYVRLAINLGRSHRIPLLFCGKVDLLDMSTLHDLEEEGLVDAPKFVPPPFNDLPALASTLSLGGFMRELDWGRLEADYSKLI